MRATTTGFLAFFATALSDHQGCASFEDYVSKFGKAYAPAELGQRRAIVEANLEEIARHNREYEAGRVAWYMAVNHLADRSPAELQRLRSTKYDPTGAPVVRLLASQPNPQSVDWREKGAVTAVKDQRGCGSCWAFSAAETVESHYAIATGLLLTLSPQTFVNCVENPHQCGGTGGCKGATMELAFNFTRDRGIAREQDMPYTGRDASCPYFTPAVQAGGYVKNPVNDAAALEMALATKGPMSITVAADAWFTYGGGIFDGCSRAADADGVVLDHGVQAVGYSQDYWIVRNSWGSSWGEEGYIRLSRASDGKTFVDSRPADGVACKPYPGQQIVGGECGILFDTSYPTMRLGVVV